MYFVAYSLFLTFGDPNRNPTFLKDKLIYYFYMFVIHELLFM